MRNSAKKAGLPFAMKEKDIPEASVCPAFGVEIRSYSGGSRAFSYSLDKIRPDLGYVPGNVCAISLKANEIKRDATAGEIFRVAVYAYFAERLAGGDPHERQLQVTALVEAVFSRGLTLGDYLGILPKEPLSRAA